MHYRCILPRQTLNKRAERKAKLDIPCNHHPFAIPRAQNVLKVALYYEDVIVPAATTRTILMGIVGNNLYNNLQINGCAFIPCMYTFSNSFLTNFKEMVGSKDYKINPLFTNFKKYGTIKFLPKTQNSNVLCVTTKRVTRIIWPLLAHCLKNILTVKSFQMTCHPSS